MALDINGYNETFKVFADFAQAKVNAGANKAIARVTVGEGPLAGRTISASTTDSTRGIFKWFRSANDKAANNATRTIFKNAIIDMFGGESKIPASVKKAMIMADYDKGKPLTARRIMAVKAAIDASNTRDVRIEKLRIESFESPAVETAALDLGFTKGELPKIARAAHFYAQATGLGEMDAMREIAEPGSKANRLMQYGGRFMENAANFANGLRLMDSFANWFQDIVDTMGPIHQQERNVRDFSSANTLTKLNIDSDLLNTGNLKGIEKFVFEELASNPAHDLSGNDPEKLFGFKDNAAMRFIGRGYGDSVLSTIANIPPSKRAAIYAAYDLFTKQAQNAQEAHFQVQSGDEYRTQLKKHHSAPFLARLLRNFDQLEAMHRKGTLTARNILDKFFPDIADKGNYDYKAINKYQADLSKLLYKEAEEGNPYADLNAGVLQTTMNNCGTTIEETVAALRAGKMPPIPNMLCTGSVELSTFDGTTQGGRSLVAADADRPANYSIKDGQQNILGQNDGFGFTFPDGTRLVTNFANKENIPTVCNKIEALCGRVHTKQASSVMMMLSQSGMTPLRGGIPSLGVICNEHSAVEFSLSKDEKTGDVTIKYSSAPELPFKFSWTTTVDVDGNVKSTPMVAEKPVAQLNAKAAGALVDGAAKKLGVNLTGAQKREAVQLLQTYGTDMYAKNAQIFARFAVNLARGDFGDEQKAAMASETAASVRGWRDFDFGDKGMEKVANAAKDYVNSSINGYMKPENDRNFEDNIYTALSADSSRATFILNGKTYHKCPAHELIPAFKNLFPDQPVKQKAISSWLNQICMTALLVPSTHNPYDNGVEAHKLPGFGSLVNRDLSTGTFEAQILNTSDRGIIHELQVSPDGKTATITQTMKVGLECPMNRRDSSDVGETTLSMRLSIDLTAEIPTVTDFQVSQKID